jgi:hypothetical protein
MKEPTKDMPASVPQERDADDIQFQPLAEMSEGTVILCPDTDRLMRYEGGDWVEMPEGEWKRT